MSSVMLKPVSLAHHLVCSHRPHVTQCCLQLQSHCTGGWLLAPASLSRAPCTSSEQSTAQPHPSISHRSHRARRHALHATADHASTSQASLPLSFTGQVMSASSNLVRVELDSPSSGVSSSDQGQQGPGHTHTAGSMPLPKTELLCSLRTLLKKLSQSVLVGDRVRVSSVDWNLGRGQVEEVFPRHSELTDPAVANVDFALLVFALTNPMFEWTQVTRFLVAMEVSGIPFRLLLNKADLITPEELDKRIQEVRQWGYEPLVVSCEEGRGVSEVLQVLENKTAVVAGPSGAGKSSLINALRLGRHKPQTSSGPREVYGAAPGSVKLAPSVTAQFTQLPPTSQTKAAPDQTFLAVGDLSRIGRGRHTTTTISLIKLPGGGRLADTPGFALPSLDRVSSSELPSLFPEFDRVLEEAGGCQFNNCMHLHEPGCAITSQQPPLPRYPIYAKLLEEIKEREETDVKLLQAGKKAREGTSKVKMAAGGRTRSEAKLDASKHRRMSRTKAKQAAMRSWDD